MSKVKLKSVVRNNPSFPTNGFTTKSYKNTNHKTLNDSFESNGFTYNIWLSENQCNQMGYVVTNKSNHTYTVNRYGDKSEIYNISQTDYFKLKRKNQKNKSTQLTQLERIERLEKLVVELSE